MCGHLLGWLSFNAWIQAEDKRPGHPPRPTWDGSGTPGATPLGWGPCASQGPLGRPPSLWHTQSWLPITPDSGRMVAPLKAFLSCGHWSVGI